MALEALSGFRPGSERESTDGRSQRQFHGLVALVIGLSQLPVALSFASKQPSVAFVVGSGGWVLVGIGVNTLRNRDAFESGWTETGRYGAAGLVLVALFTVAVVGAAVAAVALG